MQFQTDTNSMRRIGSATNLAYKDELKLGIHATCNDKYLQNWI